MLSRLTEDLAHVSVDFRVPAKEFDMDSGPAEIGSHAEVSNGSNHGDGGSNVVEDASVAGFCERQTHEGHGRDYHCGGYSPVPVGTINCQMVVGGHRVGEIIDAERMVT